MEKIILTETETNEVIRLYTEEKWGMYKIGQHMGGHSRGMIKRVLKENGVNIDTPGQKYQGGKQSASKRYREKNKESLSEYIKKWSKNNRDHLRDYHKQWRDGNTEYQEYRRNYEKNKKDSDPSYRLSCYTRTAIYTCLKERNISKYSNTFDLLPYNLHQLIEHLELQFTEGMTWDNYGEWHVDHIKPMTSFIIVTSEDKGFQDCWSLNNLQPLWAVDNLSKGSKI